MYLPLQSHCHGESRAAMLHSDQHSKWLRTSKWDAVEAGSGYLTFQIYYFAMMFFNCFKILLFIWWKLCKFKKRRMTLSECYDGVRGIISEHGDLRTKTEALKKVIQMILNGEKMQSLLMTVMRFVMPLQDHMIKKLLLIFWEVVPKYNAEGKMLHEMILVCDAYRKVFDSFCGLSFINVVFSSWFPHESILFCHF